MSDSRETAEAFVAAITKEYMKNGMFDGKPEARLTERLTRDITKLLDAHKSEPAKPKPSPAKPKAEPKAKKPAAKKKVDAS